MEWKKNTTRVVVVFLLISIKQAEDGEKNRNVKDPLTSTGSRCSITHSSLVEQLREEPLKEKQIFFFRFLALIIHISRVRTRDGGEKENYVIRRRGRLTTITFLGWAASIDDGLRSEGLLPQHGGNDMGFFYPVYAHTHARTHTQMMMMIIIIVTVVIASTKVIVAVVYIVRTGAGMKRSLVRKRSRPRRARRPQ